MGIWQIIRDNFSKAPRTHTPEQVVPHPEHYRGTIVQDATRCTACGTCAYVCSPAAITIEKDSEHAGVWKYFSGQCTYCARCVAYCPTQALSSKQSLEHASSSLEDFKVQHIIEYAHCSRCGKPYMPLPGPVLVRLYGNPLPEDILTNRMLCDACRNRLTSKNLMMAGGGFRVRRASDLIDRLNPPHDEEQ